MIRAFALSILLGSLLTVPAVAHAPKPTAPGATTSMPAMRLEGAAGASVAPFSGKMSRVEQTAQRSAGFETIQYRGRLYGGRRDGYRGNSGRDAGIAVGALIIGGIILSEAARAEHRRDHSDDWQRCANTYRSFEPSTGLYTGYDGIRRTCPYLN